MHRLMLIRARVSAWCLLASILVVTPLSVAMAQSDLTAVTPAPSDPLWLLTLLNRIPWIGAYLPYVLILFGLCAMLAAQLSPPKSADGTYAAFYRVVNVLGQNYNKARNLLAPLINASGGKPFLGAVVAPLLPALLLVGLSACTSASETQAVACLQQVAPTVAQEAQTSDASNTTKGLSSGLALLNNPNCVAAAVSLIPTTTTVPATTSPAAPATPVSTPATAPASPTS